MDLDKEHLEALAGMFKEMAQSDGVNIAAPDGRKHAVNVTPGQLSLYKKAMQMAQRIDPNRPLPPPRNEGLQETLKKLAKAKNIVLKSSGKRIK